MKITFIADTHHYSKTLGTTGKAFELRSGSDQKCLAETGDIIDSAFETIGNSDTDAVFILGDVSNDGEMVSHIEFREKLYNLKKKKPVYIITATHDWCNDGNPRRFDGVEVSNDVEVIESSALPEFYKDFGPNDAIDSFITKIGTICYTIELSKDVRVLCLNDDKNEVDHAGFTEDCWQWIEKQIQKAKEDNCLLIGIEHHLLMPHISTLIAGGSTCVANREWVASRFADAGLKYMFVGHSHIQATDYFTSEKGNTITEVNVGSLVGYPAPMVEVEVNDNKTLSYEVKHLESFVYNGKKVDAMIYLAKHSADIINRILECKNRKESEERLIALGVDGNKIGPLWYVLKPFIRKINTMLVWDAYKILKSLGLANGLTKKMVEPYRYIMVKDIIDNMWLGALDGGLHSYSSEDVYYKLVMAVVSIPSKLLPENETMQELIAAADYIMTGGLINNQKATI